MNTDNKKGAKRLFKLLTNAERCAFNMNLGLNGDADEKTTLSTLESLPRYEATRVFLGAAEASFTMMKQIFLTLEKLGASVRTTGCIFILADPTNPEEQTEVEFLQQAVDVICDWTNPKTLTHTPPSLASLESTWKGYDQVWNRLIRSATPSPSRRRINAVKTHIHKRLIYKRSRDQIDHNAQAVSHHFLKRLQKLGSALNKISEGNAPAFIVKLIKDIQVLEKSLTFENQRYHKRLLNERLIHQYTRKDFCKDFDKFIEDIQLLADLIHGESLADLLQIDLWSSRPQLYEIWVLLTVLDWIDNRGYEIELLKTTNRGEHLPLRWELSYSKDAEPIAAIKGTNCPDTFLFYQLYRPTGDMPDIALLEKADPTSSPIWSLDPKHSEKGGYSLQDYKGTAIRYHESFGAQLSLVCEFFDRNSLGDDNPIEFSSSAKFIRKVRPGGVGTTVMMDELDKFHPKKDLTLVCIDCSASFEFDRATALDKINLLYEEGHLSNCSNEYVCFAGNSLRANGINSWLRKEQKELLLPKGITQGTSSKPLLGLISEIAAEKNITKVVIVSDKEFDISVEHFADQLEKLTGLSPTWIF